MLLLKAVKSSMQGTIRKYDPGNIYFDPRTMAVVSCLTRKLVLFNSKQKVDLRRDDNR